MSVGIIGIKLGMSRIFAEDGNSYPVTVVATEANLVCQVKTSAKDGYSALQLASGKGKAKRMSKQLKGHYEKNKVPLANRLREIRIDTEQEGEYKIGDKLGVNQFIQGQKVDATGISKGKGFAGTIKRWNFAAQDATHGNSISHRHLGSTGQCQFPGKVWKGKKMAGQYGNARTTVLRLEVAGIDEENDLLLIKGAVPGASGSVVLVKPSVKQTPDELKKLEEIKKKQEAAAAPQEDADTPEAEEGTAAQPEAEAGTEAQPEAKADAPKEDAKPDAKADAPKDDAKSDAKADAPKDDAKDDAKPDAKEDAKPEAKADAPKDDAKPEDKADAPKEDAKPDAKADAPKDDAKPEAKADAPKDDAKADTDKESDKK